MIHRLTPIVLCEDVVKELQQIFEAWRREIKVLMNLMKREETFADIEEYFGKLAMVELH